MRLLFFIFAVFFIGSANGENEAIKHYEQALKYFNEGKLSAAEIAVKNSLQLELNYLPARLLLGKVLLQTGKYQAAEKELEQSKALYADSFVVVLSLVEVKLMLNKYEQALELLRLNPQLKNEYKYYYFKANAHKALNNYQHALVAYQEAIAMHQGSAEMHTALADLWYKQENIPQAQLEINKATNINPDFIPALLLSSEIFQNTEQYQLANNNVEKVLAIDSTNQQALFVKASLLLSQQQLSEALAIAIRLREMSPTNPFTKLLHSSIVAQQGQSRQARRILSDIRQQLSGIADRHKEDKAVLLLSATVDFINTNNVAAKNKFLRYIELYGDSSNARRYLTLITLKAEKYTQAQQHIEQALLLNSNSAELYLLAAEVYRQSEFVDKQVAILQKAQLKFPKNEKIRQHFVASLLAHSLFEQALAVLDKANPDSSLQNQTILGFMQLQSGQYEQAKLTTQTLLNQYNDKVEILQLAAEVSLKTAQNSAKAIYFFEQALALDENFTPALTALAGIYLQQGDVSKVEELYLQLLKINNNDALTRQLYADLAIKQGRLPLAIQLLKPLALKNDYRNGRALINLYIATKQPDLALKIIKQLEEDFPLDEGLLLSKSRVQSQLALNDSAIKSLKILYGLVYDDSDKLITLAHAQLDINDIESAEKTINRLKSIESVNVPDYLQARYTFMAKELDKANQLISKALSASTDDKAWLALKVRVLIAKNSLDQAIDLLADLYQSSNERADMQLLAQLYGQQGEKSSMARLLHDWLQHMPSDDWARAQLSALALSQGQRDVAIEVLEQAPNLAEQPVFLNNLASYYLAMQLEQDAKQISAQTQRTNLIKAQKYAQQAYKLAPNIAAISDTLGWVYVNNDQAQKGLSLLREASARDATNAEIYYHLAYTLAQLHDKTQARDAFKKAIELSPEHSLRAAVSALLNKV
ncbi:XrtA/PEP-CTERM system TPR-repeat protein PrsT [Colwelliaceae bacterium MEBiC 14330]